MRNRYLRLMMLTLKTQILCANKKGLLVVGSLGLIVLTSCGTTAPLKQRDVALAAIQRSQTVEAPRYAEELFTQAQQDYDEGQTLIVEGKKSAKNNKAKALYITSRESADNAYDKAIVPFTQAFIDETAEQLEQAKVDKVHRASEDLYNQAQGENEQAGDLLSAAEFSTATDATFQARTTLDVAVAETARLRALIDEQKALITSLQQQALAKKATNAVPAEYQSNVGNLEAMLETVEEGYYKEAVVDGEMLVGNLRALLVLIEEKRQQALRELAGAEQTITQLKGQSVTVESEIRKLNEEYQER